MKLRHDDCDPNRLRHLLDDRLDDDDQAELAEHLDGCDNCRKTLDSLAADSLWWRETRRFLGDEAKTPRHDPADASMLDFLGPSENPEHLGRLGPYEVLSVLGRGGMGLVLRAIDPALNRQVAIKVLAPELATSATARRRFAREGQAAAAISHDHIVAIHSVDASGGLPYLVMQLVAGRSLQERIDQTGPLAVEEILRIGIQTASGLAAAHDVGLIHRDIKPSNILLENCVERVKITDFGLARAIDDASLTQSGVVAGTPQYMSPEQARGDSADHRSDLFSLGSVLYALCTGRAPFRADSTPAVLRRVSEDTPRPIRELNPEIPAWLEHVVTQLHAKDPAHRYQTATEVADLLSRCLAHVHEPTLVPLPEELAMRSVRRMPRRKLAIAAMIGLFALCGLGAAEATGVTKIVSTVVRFSTSSGTLKVTINDPSIKVRIDDKDLIITGAGPEEVRVHAGVHRVVGTKDGKTIEKLVSITRGGVETVEVSLEPPALVAKEVPFTPLSNPELNATVTSEIAKAEAELKRATDRLQWSQQMFVKGYVSMSQLEGDLNAFKKAKLALDEAKRKKAATDRDSAKERSEGIWKTLMTSKFTDRINWASVKLTSLRITLDRLRKIAESGDRMTEEERNSIAWHLLDIVSGIAKVDNDWFSVCSQIKLLYENVPKTAPISDVLNALSNLRSNFLSFHRQLQAIFGAAATLAESKTGIDLEVAILQTLSRPLTVSQPDIGSLETSLQRLLKSTSTSEPKLQEAIRELIAVERKYEPWQASTGLKSEIPAADQFKLSEWHQALHPLDPVLLAKRAIYLKESLGKFALLDSQLKEAIKSSNRQRISEALQKTITMLTILDHDFVDVGLRVSKAMVGDRNFDKTQLHSVIAISELGVEFARIHHNFELWIKAAADLATHQPNIEEIDALSQWLKERVVAVRDKTREVPEVASMAQNIQMLRSHAAKSDVNLDVALAQLFAAETEIADVLSQAGNSKKTPAKVENGPAQGLIDDLAFQVKALETVRAQAQLRLSPADSPDVQELGWKLTEATEKLRQLKGNSRDPDDPRVAAARAQANRLKQEYFTARMRGRDAFTNNGKLPTPTTGIVNKLASQRPATDDKIAELQAEIARLKAEVDKLQLKDYLPYTSPAPPATNPMGPPQDYTPRILQPTDPPVQVKPESPNE